MATDGRRVGKNGDHIGAFNFKLEIDGVTVASFKKVSGLDSETEIIEFRDGDDMVPRKRPGQTKYSNIVCERGYTSTDELWKWRKTVMDGVVERKSGSIILCNSKMEEVMRYNFFEAWPCKWVGFTLDGSNNDNAVEEIHLAIEKYVRIQAGG